MEIKDEEVLTAVKSFVIEQLSDKKISPKMVMAIKGLIEDCFLG
ncbi:unnamed protein product [Fructobacillus tropaeoli]|nr:unnamed protein product [Fructobacillus tropaeoli]